MIQLLELMQDEVMYGKTAHNVSSERLCETDANGTRITDFTLANEVERSAMKKNRTEVKPMMQFKRGMMVVVRPVRATQPLQKVTTQQHVAFPRDTSATVRGVQETQRRFKRGMMIITPLEDE